MDGYAFDYVFPSLWEDHCKIGFSRDPLSRVSALHRRWFEFFDLDAGMLVETETVRDARQLELELRRPLAGHNAPAPTTVRREAAGHTEWFRGAGPALALRGRLLEQRGYRVHAPVRPWLRAALSRRGDQLYAWAEAQLEAVESGRCADPVQVERTLRDALDAYTALEIDPAPLLPPEAWRWYRRMQAIG